MSWGCYKSLWFRGRQGRVHGWGLCSSAVPQRHGHEGARALQWGFQRDTQDYFLLPFPQHSSEIYLCHLNCRLFPSSARFWAELIRALTCTPWANKCSQLLANLLGNLYESKLLGSDSAGGRGIQCWLSPGGCTLYQKAKWALTHYLSLEIAALFSTAHVAGPRGTPRALSGRTALTLLKDICQGHPPQPQPDLGCPIQQCFTLKPTERALHVPQNSHPHFMTVLPIPVWGFPIPEPGNIVQAAGLCSSSSPAFASSWCECQSQI